jgi:glycosyltransferase involved in cell wall biosynthesis
VTVRALFFLLDGDSNASSWHRVLQYVPLLRAHDIVSRIARPVPEPVYQALVERRGGGRGAGAKAGFYGLFLAQRLLDVLRAREADVVVVQRDLFPFGPPLLERLLFRRARRLVYDTDDATYLRPSFTPDTVFQRWRHFDKVAEVVRHAAWVSVATEPIAAWARRANAHVDVIPMAVDLARYPFVPRDPAGGRPLVVGWAGTPGGRRYLQTLAPILRDLSARLPLVVRVISGDGQGVQLEGVPTEVRPWRADTILAEMAQFDVGLVPLDDSPFEEAKFPFKLLQYLALGVPAVSARVGVAATVLREGDVGLLAGTWDEWRAQLERVLRDPALRARLRVAGRETVAAHYTLERVGPRFAAGLRQAAS